MYIFLQRSNFGYKCLIIFVLSGRCLGVVRKTAAVGSVRSPLASAFIGNISLYPPYDKVEAVQSEAQVRCFANRGSSRTSPVRHTCYQRQRIFQRHAWKAPPPYKSCDMRATCHAEQYKEGGGIADREGRMSRQNESDVNGLGQHHQRGMSRDYFVKAIAGSAALFVTLSLVSQLLPFHHTSPLS